MTLPSTPLTTALIALQFVAFGWRINRELSLADHRKEGIKTWLPLPDRINILSLLAVVFVCVVLPLVGYSFDKAANAVLSAGYSLIAFHPVSEAAHYRLFSEKGLSIYVKDERPWVTDQELVTVAFSLLVTLWVAFAGFSK